MSNDRSSILPIASEHSIPVNVNLIDPSPSNRQQRLLRLRNDRFPAKSLPSHGFNSRLSGLTRRIEEDSADTPPPPRTQENIALPKPRLYGNHFYSTSSIRILEEISNSIKSSSSGARARDRRAPIPIFQDTPERALLDSSPYSSPPFQYQSSSPAESPFHFANIQDSLHDMGLREVTGNIRKVSAPNSPWSGNVKPGRRRPTAPVARSNSEEYIQRIERELEFANDSVYSPNSNRSWKEKLKATQAENERLRQELADTKGTFEAEVQKAVQHKTAAEVVLRRKIRSLEDEAVEKDSLIRDLELKHDEKRLDQSIVDTLRATIDRLEFEKSGLENSNHTMSKRNEVLTHLLALSPTKSQHVFELQTPSRVSKSNRPRSLLLPRVSSSPTHTHPHRPQSLVNSPASGRDFDPALAGCSPVSPAASDSHSRFPIRPALSRSYSVQQAVGTHSRSSTVASVTSMSPTAEHRLSNTSSVERHARRASSRGARRFLPGSTQLKPLLLPTLSSEFKALSSTSPMTSPSKAPRRDFTDESIDPTVMFLSQSPLDYESDADDSLNDSYRTSARHLAYQSLEGVLDDDGSNDASAEPEVSTFLLQSEHMKGADDNQVLDAFPKSPTSAFSGDDPDRTILPVRANSVEEVDNDNSNNILVGAAGNGHAPSSAPIQQNTVEIPEPLFSPKIKREVLRLLSPNKEADDHVTRAGPSLPANYSRKRRKVSSSSANDQIMDVAAQHAPFGTTEKDGRPISGAKTPLAGSRPPSFSLLSPRGSKGPLELLRRRNYGIRPIAVVTIKTIYGTLSKCTTMLRDFKKDPLALARKVMANAWRCNWAVLGKLSWWVLGLFLGPSAKDQRARNWDWDDYDGEAIAERHCHRKSEQSIVEQQPLLKDPPEMQPDRRVRFGAANKADRKSKRDPPASKPGWGTSVMLWAKFSTAIILAVGGAMVKGPGEMMRDTDTRRTSRRSRHLRHARTSSSDSDLGLASGASVEMQDMSPRSTDNELRQRRQRRSSLCSPPPSARAVLSAELDAGLFTSSPPVSSSPAVGSFRFGHSQAFDFDMSDPHGGVDAETLKPVRPQRINIEDIFDYSNAGTPTKVPNGDQEYDVESAGLGRLRSMASTPDSLK